MTRRLETGAQSLFAKSLVAKSLIAPGLLALSLSGCPGSAPPPVKVPVRVETEAADAAPVELPLPPGALCRLGASAMTHPNLRGLTFLDDGRLMSWSHRDEERSHVRLWDDQGRLETLYETGTVVDARGRHLLIDRQGMELIHAANGRRVRRLGERNAYQLELLGDGKGHLSWNDSQVTVTRPGRDALVLDATADITAVAHGERAKVLVTAAEDDHVRLWDLTTGEQTLDIEGEDDAGHLSLSRDGGRLAMDDPAAVWDLAQNKAIFELPLVPKSLALSPDGKRLAAVHEGDLVVYDVDEARMVWMRPDVDATYLGAPQLAFSPDGKRLVAGTLDDESRLRVFAADGGKEIGGATIEPPAVAITSAAGEVWVGTGRGDIVVFDPEDGSERARLRGHDRTVRGLARSPSGRLIASTADDGMVILWDRETRTERTRFSRLKPSTLAFIDDGTLLVGHDDDPPVIWPVDEAPPDLWRIDAHEGRRLEGRSPLSAAGKTMTLTRWSTVALLDSETGRHVGSLPRDYGEVAAMSADGERIATYQGRQLILWDVTRKVTVHRRKTEGYPQLAWGKGWLAMAHGPRLQVMSEAGKNLREVVHGQGEIVAVAIVDDDRFATLSADGAALVWSRRAMPAAETEAEPPDDGLPPGLLAPLSPARSCGAAKPDGRGGHLPHCAIRRFGRRQFGHDSTLERLTFSPDGRHLAGEGGSWGRGVSVWDAKTGERRRYIPTSAMPLSVEFHPNGRDVFVRAGRQLTRWPLFDGEPRTVAVGFSDYDATAISPSGEHVAVGDAYGQVVVLETSTLKKVGALRVGLAPVRRLGFVGEDGLLAQTLGPKTAIWRWRAGEKAGDLFGDFTGFTVLPDGRLVGADAGVLRVGSPPKVYRTKLEIGERDDLAVARDGKTVAITVTDYDEKTYEDLPERVVIYDLDTEAARRSIPIGDTDAVALSPDGTSLAVAKGTSVQLWNTTTGKLRPLAAGHRQAAIAAAFVDGGQTILTADGQDVRRWDVKTGAAKGKPWPAATSHAFILPGGKQLLALDDDDAAVWTIGSPATPLKDFDDVLTVDEPSVSSDGKHFAFLNYDATLRIVRLPRLDVVHEIALPARDFENVAFLPGKVVVGGDETSWVYDVQTGQLLQTLPAAGGVATARDGTWTVIGTTVFDRDLKSVGRLEGVLPWVPLAVSTQGWAAVRGAHGRVHIYDLKSRRRVLRLPPEALGTMTVSPDGAQLLTAGDDVLLWDIEPYLE